MLELGVGAIAKMPGLAGYRHPRFGDEHLLFDEWVIACWQNRPHEGLSHTWGESRDLSPNETYAACVGISGYVPLSLTGDDYIGLLPVVFRTENTWLP